MMRNRVDGGSKQCGGVREPRGSSTSRVEELLKLSMSLSDRYQHRIHLCDIVIALSHFHASCNSD